MAGVAYEIFDQRSKRPRIDDLPQLIELMRAIDGGSDKTADGFSLNIMLGCDGSRGDIAGAQERTLQVCGLHCRRCHCYRSLALESQNMPPCCDHMSVDEDIVTEKVKVINKAKALSKEVKINAGSVRARVSPTTVPCAVRQPIT